MISWLVLLYEPAADSVANGRTNTAADFGKGLFDLASRGGYGRTPSNTGPCRSEHSSHVQHLIRFGDGKNSTINDDQVVYGFIDELSQSGLAARAENSEGQNRKNCSQKSRVVPLHPGKIQFIELNLQEHKNQFAGQSVAAALGGTEAQLTFILCPRP